MLLWCILCCICILYFVLYLYFAFCDVFVGYFWLLAAADTSCGKQRPVDWWTDSGVGAASRALYFLIYFSIYYISLLSGFGNIWSIQNRNPNFKDTNTIENTNTNANKMRNTKVSALPAPPSHLELERGSWHFNWVPPTLNFSYSRIKVSTLNSQVFFKVLEPDMKRQKISFTNKWLHIETCGGARWKTRWKSKSKIVPKRILMNNAFTLK